MRNQNPIRRDRASKIRDFSDRLLDRIVELNQGEPLGELTLRRISRGLAAHKGTPKAVS